MRTIWLVVKHDVAAALRQRSFWIISLVLPVLLIGMQALGAVRASQDTEGGGEQAAVEGPVPAVGLVDASGLIATIPAGIPAGLFERFADEDTARAALDEGRIEQYVFVPADYLDTGQVLVYDRDFRLLLMGEGAGVTFSGPNAWVLDHLIASNLTASEELAAALRNPTPGWLAEVHVAAPPQETNGNDQGLGRLVANIMPMIFYVLLLTGSSFLMQSVASEKESRTAEVMLLSLEPRQLMVGKLLAGTVVLLVQLAIWMGGGLLAFDQAADALRGGSYTFPPGFVVWASLFLVLGYLLYASIMGAVGALAPNAREGAQMTWILVVPFMPTLMFAQMFLEEPGHPVVVGLSLFPLSAPSAMVTRLAIGPVPAWQILVSLAGLAATAYLFVALSARFFKAGNLLSDASFSLRRLATGWRQE